MSIYRSFLVLSVLIFTTLAHADDSPMIRWTLTDDTNASITHVITVLSQKTGKALTEQDFLLEDDRDLAFSHYQLYEQLSGGVPVDGKSIRIWTDLRSNATIQVEAALDLSLAQNPGEEKMAVFHRFTLSDSQTNKLAQAAVKKTHEDTSFRGIDWKDRIVNGVLTRIVTIKGKHGKHQVLISHASRKIVSQSYEEFPQGDITTDASVDTMDLDALVYPVYEEVEGVGTILPRQKAKLTGIYKTVPQINGDIYAGLKSQKYFDTNFSPVLGATTDGRAKGYWSMTYLKEQAAKIRAALPQIQNDYSTGLLLQGQYATINIHPDAFTQFKGIAFTAKPSTAFFPNWITSQVNGDDVNEMVPNTGFYGKPLLSADEILTRPARRLPDNDPVSYINDGFDEIQVYYAINTLMDELHARGFTDPDLSTRPFNAFLFNPDIAYRDNAFYTDDTINFTTYSPSQPNAARDNSTIWHELGHGVMDRLMGDNIHLADTGGLSEGMADFVAQIIIQSVTNQVPFPGSDQFRIINHTGFFLTNEVHDDGEAYGGSMNDFMLAAMAKDGQLGLHKVADVILETMRLTRDHPALTAQDWFNHILFADSLGRPGVRAPGELAPLLLAAINGRNFHLDGSPVASYKLVNDADGKEVLPGEPGSRDHAIPVTLAKDATAHFDLSVNLQSSKEYVFQYPVTVKVEFAKGALQGAVHWVGKESGPKLITLNAETDTVHIPLDVTGTCDFVNREDGSCSDYAYVQILNAGETDHPRAKKRFYVQVKNPAAPSGNR